MGGGDAHRMSDLKHCYIDDSIHDAYGFIALAFVFSSDDVCRDVESALISAGMDPAFEEYKSGVRMEGNARMQEVRHNLLGVIRMRTKVAVVVAARDNEVSLGMQCLQALQSIAIRNGISCDGLKVYVDEGIFRSSRHAEIELAKFDYLSKVAISPCEKSHLCRGIQLADLVAHTLSQAVRDGVSERPRMIDAGGADSGYEDDLKLPLSDLLVAGFSYSIICRPMVWAGNAFDPATDPLIIDPDSDGVGYGLYPEALGWGVQVSQHVPDNVRAAVAKVLGRIWRGCWH